MRNHDADQASGQQGQRAGLGHRRDARVRHRACVGHRAAGKLQTEVGSQ